MTRFFSLFCALATLASVQCYADKVVWKGVVQADGAPTAIVQLQLGKKYQVQASGVMDLGRWWQGGLPLQNDACYGFNANVEPQLIQSLKNSMDISVGDGTYHPDHAYESKPFIAIQSGIHFWIYDENYNDNIGSLQVEVIELPSDSQTSN